MADKEDIWIIFGCSPFISTIQNRVPDLLLQYSTIGINLFPLFFKGCGYWLFNDNGIFTNIVKKNYSREKLIVNRNLVPELKTEFFRKDQGIIGDIFTIEPYYVFEGIQEISQADTGKLFYSYSSVLSAMNYALIKGAKKIILAGIDLDNKWRHFYGYGTNVKSMKSISSVKSKIELFKAYTEVLKLNKNANIDVESVDIEKL